MNISSRAILCQLTIVSSRDFVKVLEIDPTPETRRAFRQLRKKWHISIRELAIISGYAEQTVNTYEQNYKSCVGRIYPSRKAMRDMWESLGILIAERRGMKP